MLPLPPPKGFPVAPAPKDPNEVLPNVVELEVTAGDIVDVNVPVCGGDDDVTSC